MASSLPMLWWPSSWPGTWSRCMEVRRIDEAGGKSALAIPRESKRLTRKPCLGLVHGHGLGHRCHPKGPIFVRCLMDHIELLVSTLKN